MTLKNIILEILKSDDELRQILPNLQRASASETPWLARLMPFIDDACRELEMYFFDARLFNNIAEQIQPFVLSDAQKFVAWSAWAHAMPTLNLVATPSGFGVVSTSTVAPASADRVNAAIDSAYKKAAQHAQMLLDILRISEIWRASIQADWFKNIFVDLSIFYFYTAVYFGKTGLDTWTYFKDTYIQLDEISTVVKYKILGPDAYKILIDNILNPSFAQNHKVYADIIAKLRKISVASVKDKNLLIFNLFDFMDDAPREHDPHDLIKAWKQSSIYKAFKHPKYENKQNDPGFFF